MSRTREAAIDLLAGSVGEKKEGVGVGIQVGMFM